MSTSGPKLIQQSSRVHDQRLYKPLKTKKKEIRLLTVDAGTFDDDVRGSLSIVSLVSLRKPKYETTSYRWGKSVGETVEIEGLLVKVPHGGLQALRRLRLPDRKRILWMDSICINQEDVAERSQQVSMMDEIYRSSSQNLIHLGEDDEGQDSKRAHEIILSIARDIKREAKNISEMLELIMDEVTILRDSETPIGVNFEPKPLLDFFSRPWFTRIWIIQEAVLPPKSVCYCGDEVIALRDALAVGMWLKHKRLFLPSALEFDKIINPVAHLWFKTASSGGTGELDFFNTFGGEFLGMTDAFEATDPRDRVYGVLGIYQGNILANMTKKLFRGLPPLLEPDYIKKTWEVYRDATRYLIEENRSLEYMQNIDHQVATPEHPEYPSWVPHWDEVSHKAKRESPDPIPAQLSSFYNPMNESRTTMWTGSMYRFKGLANSFWKPSATHKDGDFFGKDPNVLLVAGLSVDRIARVSATMTKDLLENNTHSWYELVLQTYTGKSHLRLDTAGDLLDNVTAVPNNTFKTEQEYNALATTLLAGCNSERLPTTVNDLQGYAHFTEYIARTRAFPPPYYVVQSSQTPVDAHTRSAARFRTAAFDACEQRCFFMTESGKMGLGPRTMRAGDTLVVLKSCPWPCILQQIVGEKYAMRGICYAHGIMYGEAMDTGAKLTKFEIC